VSNYDNVRQILITQKELFFILVVKRHLLKSKQSKT